MVRGELGRNPPERRVLDVSGKMSTASKHRVYLAKIDDCLETRLREGLDYIQWERYVNKGTRVFVKPNFTFPRYKEGVTTNPEFLRSLLEILRSHADRVILGESDGGNHSFKAEEAFEGHRMYQICRETGVEIVNLSKLPAKTIESSVLGKKVQVQLPTLLLEEIDCFISVPVLKVHVMTTVSLSLKNSWGCVPDTMRGMHHQNLASKLALIAAHLKPRILVVDGTYALDKHGPMYGEPVKTNLLVVSDNMVASDALCARLMGFEPTRINHIGLAEKVGLGSASLEGLEINRDWREFRHQFSVNRTLIDRISVLHFNNDFLARLIFQSPLTSAIYKIVPLFRTSKEKEVASQMGKQEKVGPY